MELAREFFAEAADSSGDLAIPSFDKSLFFGDGDRLPPEKWKRVPRSPPINVIIFEGWCVGFQSLPSTDVESIRLKAIESRTSTPTANKDDSIESQFATTTLADHDLEHLLFINEQLKKYCESFLGPRHLDFMVHLDTYDLANVYTWRIQQEHALIKAKGSGMTDEGVVKFGMYCPDEVLRN